MTHRPDPDTQYYVRLLVDRVPSMLAYWDNDLLCRFANKAYEQWFGVNPERLIGTSLRDLLGPELFAKNEPHIRAALAGERQVFERIVPGPGGVQRNSLAEYIPHIVDGTVRGFLVQVTEFTELRQTQDALRREQQYRTELQAQAAEVSALLRERTEMLYVLAHEVRQPLNNASAALQSAHAALRDTSDALVSDEVVHAQAVLGEVLSNIDNTIAVASLLARPNPIHREDTDIDTWLRIVIADLPEAQQGRIQRVRETSIRTVLMDMSLLRLALRNLLSNALRCSPPESSVVVRIADSDDPPALLIDVEDTGPGIPADLLPRLFTRGVRGAVRDAGHGVGLYIVRQVMQLHGGTVDVVRNGPGGVTLRLTLCQTDGGP
ncbi:MAG: PAS domain-containing sensor histidine kinase [Acidovorax sp.]|uniref:sensor histidine kinase n=1 Tax=Acidovorax sp. TaxID=1872122 RepID=UPI0025C4C634|nr:PAS domain-containing sensor histidine kinase [Acidovorax sp.]MCE1190616.1 PAS domain-containing sensor histidine kinase [Acidovorax sp.]